MSSYEYHQILQFLYFEGYADSYESAECLLESLDDGEFEDLCERATRPTRLPKSRERDIETGVRKEAHSFIAQYLHDEGYVDTIESAELMVENISDEWVEEILGEDDSWKEKNFKPLSKDKKERVTGFLNRQMIKLKDYTNQADIAQDELKNPDYSKPPKVKIGTLLKKMKTGSKLMSNAQQARKRTTEREEGRNNIRKFKREDLEYILDTLISEGFAIDYDSAGCILEAMSDEWAIQILESEDSNWNVVRKSASRRKPTTGPIRVGREPVLKSSDVTPPDPEVTERRKKRSKRLNFEVK